MFTKKRTIQAGRGFTNLEFENRTKKLQRHLQANNIDIAFFTTKAEVQYFSGFNSPFWLSPTRPWFLVIPATSAPVAVIPTIGIKSFEDTWIKDIRSWPSPNPPFDGIKRLTSTIKEYISSHKKIAGMLGSETHLRMPIDSYKKLVANFSECDFVDISKAVFDIRSIKSPAEIANMRYISQITESCFDDLKDFIKIGMSERDICKWMQTQLLEKGADNCPYIVTASGQNGYYGIINQATDRKIQSGDIFVLDTGSEFGGYFADFDRNYGFGEISTEVLTTYKRLNQAIDEALKTAKAGITTGDLWQSMSIVLAQSGIENNSIGRMGHGLGIELTEWPSVVANGKNVLKAGMVLTLEPSLQMTTGKMLVFEENILITDTGYELLHPRTWPDLPIITD